MAIGIGSAVLVGIGAATAGAAMSAAMTILAGIIGGAIIGAVVGGIGAAITGGSIGKGILYGAVGGAVTGGIAGWSAGAGTLAYGTAAEISGVTAAANVGGSSGIGAVGGGTPAGVGSVATVAEKGTSGALLGGGGGGAVQKLGTGGGLWEGAGTAAVQMGGQMLMGSAQEDLAKEQMDSIAAREETGYEFQAGENALNRETQLQIEKGRNLTTLEKTKLDNQMAMDNARLQYKLGRENLDEKTAAREEALAESYRKQGRQQGAVQAVDIKEGGAFKGGPSIFGQVRQNTSGMYGVN